MSVPLSTTMSVPTGPRCMIKFDDGIWSHLDSLPTAIERVPASHEQIICP